MSQFNGEPDPSYGGETIIAIAGGGSIRCPSAEIEPDGVDYVRVCDSEEKEIAYWNHTEWCESPEQAREVMGAILGAARGTTV